ncbi:pirin family protein [Sphingobium yanoikuyae]|uniref:Pirin family protein n=1 Tax=Sphingobium yanoikuyae TaxID=13690 RepID=A0A9X7U798_SPHYA|nr:pirin family protein [Sphingobium yanoikuyae]QNG43964.1 pirin family protein [Sphingobium yanoikuyae]
MKKTVLGHHGNGRTHWVGDGFPVRSLFSYHEHGAAVSPFLLLDFVGPHFFEPSTGRRGVGQHPHRGFETVSIVFDGEVEHRDSAGHGGVIGPGDVQWMTAGAGIVHEEYHSPAFVKGGGRMNMVQLWVNLPAADKMARPAYQSIVAAEIPVVELRNGAGLIRIIAGEFDGFRGPARTFTPINVWDLRLEDGKSAVLSLPEGHTTMVVVIEGRVTVDGTQIGSAEIGMLSRQGSDVTLQADGATTLLLLSGAPIDEPIAGYGPFVMNSAEDIRQAIADFNSGRFVAAGA